MGRKYRNAGRRTIDPRKVKRTVRSEAAVQGYMANPSWSGPDLCGNGGSVTVDLNLNGDEVCSRGNHRIEAAARRGRRIKVDYRIQVGAEDKPKGFLDWLFS